MVIVIIRLEYQDFRTLWWRFRTRSYQSVRSICLRFFGSPVPVLLRQIFCLDWSASPITWDGDGETPRTAASPAQNCRLHDFALSIGVASGHVDQPSFSPQQISNISVW